MLILVLQHNSVCEHASVSSCILEDVEQQPCLKFYFISAVTNFETVHRQIKKTYKVLSFTDYNQSNLGLLCLQNIVKIYTRLENKSIPFKQPVTIAALFKYLTPSRCPLHPQCVIQFIPTGQLKFSGNLGYQKNAI